MLDFSKRDQPIQGALFSIPALLFLKVAHIKGIEIEIDHPMVPMDLVRVNPNEKYEVPYFFLEGYEGEVPEGYKNWLAENPIPKESIPST